ncbi:TIM22 complex subunit [Yamadazyma tenuis]|uniref:Mitochondrial import inner membrane translocase subunit n=1 Tax=Candida tenuis (strain ATCC 10573 / BCRC 21748 / CBS 615 / JCM 9827 / NBRC 10315 / NRRL Y-1498 / VKM Y-70) TaxID=590646 RepID=G3BCH3_CANTC|nr:uncharacterized protein CANTEDRAFT_111182 [Yamadazyma tenuis ATCC 10573]EGV60159.1 hypothetical protein CANTEDRAFT_111182 [Yamadazyma tenuis ATCC 10573]WEJ94601.1 TIM22 complex subunit [Yamadazyma tenuis]
MSLFLGGQAQFQNVDPEKIKLADIQFDAQNLMFKKLLSKCNTKCIAREYGEADLNTGEQSCVDRCAEKFFKTNRLMGETLQYNRQFNIQKMPDYQKVQSMLHQPKN